MNEKLKQKNKKNPKIQKRGRAIAKPKVAPVVLEITEVNLDNDLSMNNVVEGKENYTTSNSYNEKPTLVNFLDLVSNKSYKIIVPVTIFVFVLIVAGIAVVNSRSQIKAKPVVAGAVAPNPAELARQNALNLISQVSKVILLPTNEDPTIETVADLNLLKGQAFFNSAKVGDKVLVYLKSGKAYLFRPDENKIIEVGTFESVVSNSKAKKTTATKK